MTQEYNVAKLQKQNQSGPREKLCDRCPEKSCQPFHGPHLSPRPGCGSPCRPANCKGALSCLSSGEPSLAVLASLRVFPAAVGMSVSCLSVRVWVHNCPRLRFTATCEWVPSAETKEPPYSAIQNTLIPVGLLFFFFWILQENENILL